MGTIVAGLFASAETNASTRGTDADGLEEGAELKARNNPLDGDTDDDGLTDGLPLVTPPNHRLPTPKDSKIECGYALVVDWKLALDRHGFFFQKKVQRIVERSLNKLAEAEVPARAGTGDNVEETSIDFRLKMAGDDKPTFDLIFECKKTYKKEWLFLRATRDKNKFGAITVRQVSGPPEVVGTPSSFHLFYAEPLQLGKGSTHEICDYGFECELGNEEKAGTGPLLDAGRQLSIALHQSLADATMILPTLDEMETGAKVVRLLALPVLITNAPLLVASFEVDEIALATGNIDAQAFATEQRPWLVYRYRAPMHLIYPEFAEVEFYADSEEDFIRYQAALVREAAAIDILVVHAPTLEEFLARLLKSK